MNRLQGRPVDHPPNFDIMMQFAAHYINQPLSRYYLDYRVLCKVNFAVQQDFDLDIVQAISDPYRETADFGADIEFPEDGLPMSLEPLIKEPDDISKLKSPDPCISPRMNDRLEAIRTMREQVGGKVPIMGWVEGALAEAADLRHVNDLMVDLVRHPDWLKELLEITVEVGIAFATAQVEAGADIIGLGDAVASLISPNMYREFALPYEQRIIEAVHAAGGLARLHICGSTGKILTDMLDSGADIIDIDWMVNIERAAAAFGDDAALCGNFDPVAVMLQGTSDQVREATLTCGRLGGSRWISAAGCEIPDGTPGENLIAQTQTLAEMGNLL